MEWLLYSAVHQRAKSLLQWGVHTGDGDWQIVKQINCIMTRVLVFSGILLPILGSWGTDLSMTPVDSGGVNLDLEPGGPLCHEELAVMSWVQCWECNGENNSVQVRLSCRLVRDAASDHTADTVDVPGPRGLGFLPLLFHLDVFIHSTNTSRMACL